MLCSAVSRLERDTPVSQGRTHQYDDAAIAPYHSRQRRARAIHLPKICYFGYAPELLRAHIDEFREHPRKCVVHPNVDGSELGLDLIRCPLDLIEVANVGRNCERLATQGGHFFPSCLQTLHASAKQA